MHITSSRGTLHKLRNWDKTSACEGTFESCHWSIIDLVSPTQPWMNAWCWGGSHPRFIPSSVVLAHPHRRQGHHFYVVIQAIWRSNHLLMLEAKISPSYSVTWRVWVLVRLGFKPTTSHSAEWHLSAVVTKQWLKVGAITTKYYF